MFVSLSANVHQSYTISCWLIKVQFNCCAKKTKRNKNKQRKTLQYDQFINWTNLLSECFWRRIEKKSDVDKEKICDANWKHCNYNRKYHEINQLIPSQFDSWMKILVIGLKETIEEIWWPVILIRWKKWSGQDVTQRAAQIHPVFDCSMIIVTLCRVLAEIPFINWKSMLCLTIQSKEIIFVPGFF